MSGPFNFITSGDTVQLVPGLHASRVVDYYHAIIVSSTASMWCRLSPYSIACYSAQKKRI